MFHFQFGEIDRYLATSQDLRTILEAVMARKQKTEQAAKLSIYYSVNSAFKNQ